MNLRNHGNRHSHQQSILNDLFNQIYSIFDDTEAKLKCPVLILDKRITISLCIHRLMALDRRLLRFVVTTSGLREEERRLAGKVSRHLDYIIQVMSYHYRNRRGGNISLINFDEFRAVLSDSLDAIQEK